VQTTGTVGGCSVGDVKQRCACGRADVKHLTISCPQAIVHPAHKSFTHVGEVEHMVDQTVRSAKNQSPIIRPRPLWLTMGSEFPHAGDGISLDGGAILELHGHTQSIADERAPEATQNTISS
jgi:hypothetical protein